MKRTIFMLGFILVFCSIKNAFCAEILVINGLPIAKVTSDISGTELVPLSEVEKNSYRLLITKRGDKYYWASRENKELQLSKSGVFYNFIEPNGAGYIRMTIIEGKTFYMEHLTLGLNNITYWGTADELNLE